MLLYKSVFRLGQNLLEIFFGKAVQRYSYRETSLKLRNKVCRFSSVESTCTYKEYMVCLNRTVLGFCL